ncbi:MAG: response regulator transcription factor [Verrucomicrobiota bacterium]
MKVLVADDDPVTRESVQAALEAEGFAAVTARDGDEALEQWRIHRPRLLCLDIMMPGTNGYEVCRRIRAEDDQVPILFLSAKSEEIDVVVGLELGADDFIRKPFGKREILARLRAVLRRAAPARRERKCFELAGLTVYPAELAAERDGSNIDLSPREVAILQLLHERVGEAVPRHDFLDRCWGLDYYPDSRTLDQHISKLRKRIEIDPENPVIITTVRSVGYRSGTLRGPRPS